MKQKLCETEKADIFHFEIFKYNSFQSIFKNLIFFPSVKKLLQVIFLHRKFQTGNGNHTRLNLCEILTQLQEVVGAREAQMKVMIIGFHLQ